ncbi:MAG: hypothetical protein ACE5JX_19175 [Acidobacteriota bacterium]
MKLVENLLIGCALRKEARALKEHLGRDLPVIVTGVGSQRTARALKARFRQGRPSLLLFTGTAGQLAPSLRLGEFVFPAQWRMENGTAFSADKRMANSLRLQGWEVSGLGLTVPTPALRKGTRLELHRTTGAKVCDMESAAAMEIAASHQIPCLAPKIVSDTMDSDDLAFYYHFDDNMKKLGDCLKRLVQSLGAVS